MALLPICFTLKAQDPWKIIADQPNAGNYYGVTIANGMIGIVSSPEPFKVKNVVLAGAYDQYGRGRVSNFLNSFNLLNMYLEIDGKRLTAADVSNFRQGWIWHHASFKTTFDYGDKATILYILFTQTTSFTGLTDVSIKAKKAITINAASVMEAPDALKEVRII